jgi:hypothetical protein
MKSLLAMALVLAASSHSLACTVKDANDRFAGRVDGGVVTAYSGNTVGLLQGNLVLTKDTGVVLGIVTPGAILNFQRQPIGFTTGSVINNYMGEKRGEGLNCSQEEMGAALILILGV